jgi:hypothetical protein
MKRIGGLILAVIFWLATASAQSPVTVTVRPQTSSTTIPASFAGLSFGMRALLADKDGGHFFSATNTPLVLLFQNAGIKHLRVGGTTVEAPPTTPIPDESDIDNLFAFARAAGVRKIIYSLRLLETNAALNYRATNAAIAKYIWNHYRSQLDCFAVGNEPDLKRVFHQDATITNFSTYLSRWRLFADAITNAVPGATFVGPDGGSGNTTWTARFVNEEKNSGLVTAASEHYYAGGKGRGLSAEDAIDSMLSPEWLSNYQKLYEQMAVPVMAAGLPYRFTEANDHYSGGVPGASDTFTGVLWALDFLHWWAAHQAGGVDFHNTEWVVSDIVTPGQDGKLRINPKGYGLKAFELGGHGSVQALTISNPDNANVTAYASRDGANLFVTVINKSHGANAVAAKITIVPDGSAQSAEAIFLRAPNDDVTAKTGITLGGAAISGAAPWQGKWSSLPVAKAGHCAVDLAVASAVIVKISEP